MNLPHWPLWWVDLPLLVIAAEALLLRGLWRRGRTPLPPLAWLWGLLAGLALLAALRCALAGLGPWVVAPLLALGGLCHALDLRQRWRSCARSRTGAG
jgi:hypothetical protein